MRRSAGLISISMCHRSRVDEHRQNEVWRRPPESNGDLRTRRCTPVSVRSQPKAYSPVNLMVADLMPATSPSEHSMSSGFVAVGIAPAQVHAQHHVGPVLGLGATGTGLDVDVAVGTVVLTGEHATELEIHQLGLQLLVGFDHGFVEGLFVFAFDGQADQHLDVIDALGQGIDGADDVLQGTRSLPSACARSGSFQTSGCSSSALTSSRRSFLAS